MLLTKWRAGCADRRRRGDAGKYFDYALLLTLLNVSTKRYYLSVLIDLFNNEVVSYQFSSNLGVGFEIHTVKQAIDERSAKDLLIHSDQGLHYTMHEYKKLLREKGIIQSMPRKGNGLENACGVLLRAFESRAKTHLLYSGKLAKIIQDYIHFYNNERSRQSIMICRQ
ncbi:Integrase core domain-containing protein [Alicyclobacillus tolerans]|uniref:Integrase core domain-containing protein n=1 Tax=Alicyclobacillus tolerans TaxID=90970 RepID=A0A1M6TG56_9BACL|nr:Integrase core domain-containing protein [Alicyclobacillus montanus]